MTKRPLRVLLAAAVWLLIWEIAALAVGKGFVLASPVEVVFSLVNLVPTPDFWLTCLYSLGRIAAGFCIALVLGVALAWLSTLAAWLRDFISLPVRAISAIPVVSFIILVLIWADSSLLTVTVSAIMVLPVVYSNVLEGLDSLDPKLDEMAAVFDLPRVRRWRAVVFPQLYPYLRAASRTGLGLCWKAGVSAEVIGLPSGSIGEQLYQAKIFLDTPELFAWTAVIVVLSFAFARLVLWLLACSKKLALRGLA
ncbi:MAG: ABC transporter permease subunit [Propionibacteriaceae bacterium]|jgi:NitT/TauT family transport system permease protein|nr:ABC transporter permease subunit [Propionibacteriaceae bacterium]